ncbi:MAG: cyclic nucleotide-binding domain-containing protein, partial [Myxococcota bacterium]
MVSSTMRETLAARLGQHPPFDALDPESLALLASSIRVRYLEKGAVLFEAGEAPRDEIYQVQKGSLELTRPVKD